MRVLFVSHTFPPAGEVDPEVGGMQRVAPELAATLAESSEVDLELLVLRAGPRLPVLRTAVFIVRLLLAIPGRLRRGGLDLIVHSSMVTASTVLLLGGRTRRAGVRTVAIAHGRDVTLRRWGYQLVASRILSSVSGVFPVSSAVAEACIERGIPSHRVHVVPNGTSIPLDPGGGAREGARGVNGSVPPDEATERAGPDQKLKLLSVGRLVERKGFEWFVREVFPLLPPEVEYSVVGEGPELGRLVRAARAIDAGDRVRFLGRLTEKELDGVYRDSDLLIMPNIEVKADMEGFGVVAIEAGSRGLPVIAADREGMRDVIAEGVNGHRIRTADARGFADVITRYAHGGGGDDLRLAARRHVEETFSWPVVGRRFVDALARVMETPEAAP